MPTIPVSMDAVVTTVIPVAKQPSARRNSRGLMLTPDRWILTTSTRRRSTAAQRSECFPLLPRCHQPPSSHPSDGLKPTPRDAEANPSEPQRHPYSWP